MAGPFTEGNSHSELRSEPNEARHFPGRDSFVRTFNGFVRKVHEGTGRAFEVFGSVEDFASEFWRKPRLDVAGETQLPALPIAHQHGVDRISGEIATDEEFAL